MNIYIQILITTALTGVGGLALGGLLAVLVHGPSDRQMSLLLRFTAGIMLGVVCFDLIADAREQTNMVAVIVWIVAGFLLGLVLIAGGHIHVH